MSETDHSNTGSVELGELLEQLAGVLRKLGARLANVEQIIAAQQGEIAGLARVVQAHHAVFEHMADPPEPKPPLTSPN